MKIAIHSGTCGPDKNKLIKYCGQIGVDQLCMGCSEIPGYDEQGYPSTRKLKEIRDQFADAGIAIAVVSPKWPSEDALLGQPTGAQELGNLCRTIDSLGEVGIETMLLFTIVDEVANAQERQDRWQRLAEFYQKLVEHAEEAKVKIATHGHFLPDKMIRNTQTLRKLVDLVPSENNGVTYCLGCNQLIGDDIYQGIRLLGQKIFFIHIRDVRGNWEKFEEVFPGTGDIDFWQVMQALREIGYQGVLCPEHFPHVEGEARSEIGTAWVVGYLKALLSIP